MDHAYCDSVLLVVESTTVVLVVVVAVAVAAPPSRLPFGQFLVEAVQLATPLLWYDCPSDLLLESSFVLPQLVLELVGNSSLHWKVSMMIPRKKMMDHGSCDLLVGTMTVALVVDSWSYLLIQ